MQRIGSQAHQASASLWGGGQNLPLLACAGMGITALHQTCKRESLCSSSLTSVHTKEHTDIPTSSLVTQKSKTQCRPSLGMLGKSTLILLRKTRLTLRGCLAASLACKRRCPRKGIQADKGGQLWTSQRKDVMAHKSRTLSQGSVSEHACGTCGMAAHIMLAAPL